MTRLIRLLLLVLPIAVVSCADLSALIEPQDPAPEEMVRAVSTPNTVEQPAPTPTVKSVADMPLLFVSDRGIAGTTDIYQINADGSGFARLTEHPANDLDPQWSADQQTIAFASDRTGASQIYLMSTHDYSIEQLTDDPNGAASPTWAPDGNRIAYVAPDASGNTVTVVDARSGTPLESIVIDLSGVTNPAWSPFGGKIAFSAQTASGQEDRSIIVFDLISRKHVNLTNSPSVDDYPTWSPDEQRLAFQSDRGGNADIYVMKANGALQTPLTTDPAADVEPSWSSYSGLISFSSDRAGQFDVYLMSESGSDQTIVSRYEANDRQSASLPQVARDTGDLVYSGGILTDFRDLHLTNAEGTVRRQLTDSDRFDETMPDWSPDGSRIVFASSRAGNYDIYVMKSDGTDLVQLTSNPGDDMHPSWSPDGREIAYESRQGDVDWDVWVMNPDGSGQRNLTARDNHDDGSPTWSPDGTRLAFISNRLGNFDLYVTSADGTDQPLLLSRTAENDFHPDWSPDGAIIAHRSNSLETGLQMIRLTAADGSSARDLFTSEWNDDTPAWSVDGLQIAFSSDRPGDDENAPAGRYRIFVYDLETDSIRQITHGNRDGRYPAWRPSQ